MNCHNSISRFLGRNLEGQERKEWWTQRDETNKQKLRSSSPLNLPKITPEKNYSSWNERPLVRNMKTYDNIKYTSKTKLKVKIKIFQYCTMVGINRVLKIAYSCNNLMNTWYKNM